MKGKSCSCATLSLFSPFPWSKPCFFDHPANGWLSRLALTLAFSVVEQDTIVLGVLFWQAGDQRLHCDEIVVLDPCSTLQFAHFLVVLARHRNFLCISSLARRDDRGHIMLAKSEQHSSSVISSKQKSASAGKVVEMAVYAATLPC